jgi:hypothetical protein
MSTNEDIWLDARDLWGVDRLAWEGDDEDGADDRSATDRGESQSAPLEDRPF